MDIPCPEKFSFDTQKWPAWKLRFQRFRMASDLCSKDEERQVSMLLYCMGEKSEDVFASFKLTADDAKKYDVVLKKFDAHFVVKRNVIFERAQFNNRRQEQGESMEAFITALHKLAETCEFGALREELIRDRIVVGIQDSKLSEKLQLDKDLTLDKAVTLVRQAEQVRQQQGLLRSTSATTSATSEVNAVKANKSQDRNRQQKLRKQNQGQPCKWCGRTPRHEREQCPARNATCRNCNKPGHFEKVCRSEKAAIRAVDATIDTLFVDTLNNNLSSSDTWQAELKVNDKLVKFRLDTGADATVLPLDTFNQLLSAPLSPPDKVLCGPNRAKLDVVGYFTAVLEWRGKQTTQTVYVLRDVHQPLLGQSAIEALGLIKRLCAVTDNTDPKQQYSDLFTGLGCMEGEYTIRLKPDAQPFAVFTPRRVPVNLLPQLKNELDKLESLGVIKRVDEPTPWVAPIVVIPKKTSGIRLCVDLTQLNNAVLREQYTLPAIDQMLARIAGAKVFSKLDCNSGFYQIPLSNESMLLTTFTTPYGRWCYTRLPFGISSASEVYQRKMNDILRDLDGVQCLIDDVLVYGKDKTEHDARLHSVLDRFRRANVTLNDKCEFGVTQIKFAGHVISSDGISVDPNKLTAIINMTPPTDATGMRCFMGRQLRSTVPTTTASLQPQTPDTSKLQEIDRDIKARQATSYNASHRARDGKRWQVNDRVWVPDLQSEAIVIGVLPYRAYQLRTAANNIIRRNGRSLRHPLPAKSVTTSTEALPSASLPSATTNARCRVRDIATPPQQPRAVPPLPNHQRHMGLPTTRSGRTIRPPTRLNT